MLAISVIIPTFKRVHDLDRCLRAVLNQTRPPDEIIVVARDTDEETQSFLDLVHVDRQLLKTVLVTEPGQVAALNAGLETAKGHIAAITDDDAAPRPDWLLHIERRFDADPRLGGLGGRDWVVHGERIEAGTKKTVGKVRWFGRVIGNHHLGAGEAREVDFLKGANMSYRLEAIRNIRFQARLKGTGAQVYNDMDFSMAVKRAGWKLLYDPLVAIDHYPAVRFDEDQRNSYNPVALYNVVHNETYVLVNRLGKLRSFVCLVWAISVGSRSSPGFLQWLRLLPYEGADASKKWGIALRGRMAGIRTWRQTK